MKHILLSILLLTGCSINVLEYDFEKQEAEQVEKIKQAQSKKKDPFDSPPTPPYVKIFNDDDVYVEVFRLKDISFRDIVLQQWEVYIKNKNNYNICVAIKWKLQDFELQSEYPTMFLLKPDQYLDLGKMKQTVWAFDKIFVALPPSGYVDSAKILEAQIDKKTNKYTCDMEEDSVEENVEEK